MKTIEEIKIELTLKKLSGEPIPWISIKDLPIDDDLRTFVCSLGPECSCYYAGYVDKKPHSETREGACKDPNWAFKYASVVDNCATPETRAAVYKDSFEKIWYDKYFGE